MTNTDEPKVVSLGTKQAYVPPEENSEKIDTETPDKSTIAMLNLLTREVEACRIKGLAIMALDETTGVFNNWIVIPPAGDPLRSAYAFIGGVHFLRRDIERVVMMISDQGEIELTHITDEDDPEGGAP